ncbi:MAG TPA: hypothetical protein VNJ05_08000, partial [Sphingomicrobium sp.]|nr:hypothetical protein [Sphingomicrobium sp.]
MSAWHHLKRHQCAAREPRNVDSIPVKDLLRSEQIDESPDKAHVVGNHITDSNRPVQPSHVVPSAVHGARVDGDEARPAGKLVELAPYDSIKLPLGRELLIWPAESMKPDDCGLRARLGRHRVMDEVAAVDALVLERMRLLSGRSRC